MNNKQTRFVVDLQQDEYVSLIADYLDKDLIASIETNKKQLIGVFAPPNAGKTTLMHNRAKRNRDVGIYTVIVSPTILLNNKISVDLDNAKSFDGCKFDDATKHIIVSTPESLMNVISVLEDKKLYFTLEVDEIHERVDSVDTRPLFANIDKAKDSKYCILTTVYTGTPKVIERFYDFTKIYEIKKEGKSIANNPKVITVSSMTEKSIKDILEYSYLNFRNQKGQVFAFINDKKKHSYIEDNLDTEIFKYDNSTDILYISAKTKDTKVVRDIIETKKVPDKYRMIIVTSSASTGVEFELNNPATVLAFCNNYTFNIRQEVQSTVRVRSDIDNLVFIKPDDKGDIKPISYDVFFDNKIARYKDILNKKINFWEKIKHDDFIKSHGTKTKEGIMQLMNFGNTEEDYRIEEFCSKALIYDCESDTFRIDNALLHKYISDEYADMVLKNTDFFIDTMKEQCTHFNLKQSKFEILDYDNLFKDDKLLEVIQEVLEPLPEITIDKEKDKKDKKSIIENNKNKLKKCETSYQNMISIILEEDALPSRCLHKDAYNSIEELKILDTTYKALKELLVLTTNNENKERYLKEYLDGVSTTRLNTYKKEMYRNIQIPVARDLAEANDIQEIKKQPVAVQEKCHTLIFYKKGTDARYPYRKVTINDKSQRELFRYLQTQGLYEDDEFTDNIEKHLNKLIDELFNLESIKSKSKSKSKSISKRISSLKKY